MSDRYQLRKNKRGRECKKRILFITGTRADFGKLKTLIQKVEESPEFQACIFATGMHMLSRYGSTVNEIFKAGFRNIYSYINQDGSVSSQMDLVLANTIYGLAHYVREFPPDLMVIHGDQDIGMPASHSQRLYEAAAGPREIWFGPGPHSNIVTTVPTKYEKHVFGFLDAHLGPARAE